MNRRDFLTRSTVLGLASVAPTLLAVPAAGPRKFTLSLSPGALGIRAGQMDAIRMAANFGFESVEPFVGYLAGIGEAGRRRVVDALDRRHLAWGVAGLPVDFRNDDAAFQKDLAALPASARALREARVTRVSTWLSPGHTELPYEQNFERHRVRLAEIARVLEDNGLRFGLEYVGTRTLWASSPHPFIHTMAQARELVAAIGSANVGLVLDSWHWYTAGESVGDLLSLSTEEVVSCDLNDAPRGVRRDEQIDNRRELPLATGVIDLRGFLGALVRIGFDGPARAEPFNQPLREMDPRAAAAATARSLYGAAALV